MSSISLFRIASRAVRPSGFIRTPQLPRSRVQAPIALAINRPSFSTTTQRRSGHEDETYEEFSARYDPVPATEPLESCASPLGRYAMPPVAGVVSLVLPGSERESPHS